MGGSPAARPHDWNVHTALKDLRSERIGIRDGPRAARCIRVSDGEAR
jgi:hypothetical protein